jgi:hypothetical protein
MEGAVPAAGPARGGGPNLAAYFWNRTLDSHGKSPAFGASQAP